MKRNHTLIVLVLVIIISGITLMPLLAQERIIEDESFNEFLKEKLQIDSDPTPMDMETLTSLSLLNNNNVTSLSGLEFAVNLESITLQSSPLITDFSALRSLKKLRSVNLYTMTLNDESMPIFDDHPFLTNLQYNTSEITEKSFDKILKTPSIQILDISNSKVKSISSLAKLPNLERLTMQFTAVSDFSVIPQFPKLSYLSAYGQSFRGSTGTLNFSDLQWDEATQTIRIPEHIIDNRFTNFNNKVYQPRRTNRYIIVNGSYLSADSTQEDLVVDGMSVENFKDIKTLSLAVSFDMEDETTLRPPGYTFYNVSEFGYVKDINLNKDMKSFSMVFRDDLGAIIAPETVIKGAVLDDYTLVPPEISGYQYKSSSNPLHGRFEFDQFSVITLNYIKTLRHHVTFDSNGGSYVSDISDVIPNTVIKEPKTPFFEGHTFLGWEHDGLPWDFTRDTVNSDMVLRAVWKIDDVIVNPTQPLTPLEPVSPLEPVYPGEDQQNHDIHEVEESTNNKDLLNNQNPNENHSEKTLPATGIQTRTNYAYLLISIGVFLCIFKRNITMTKNHS